MKNKQSFRKELNGTGSVEFSVVMPCLNEEPYIRKAIISLLDDDFRERGELIVVDGMSSDGTRDAVKEFLGEGYQVRLLDNPHKTQAWGLNTGIKAAKGKFISRADAHCIYPRGYVKRCIELLEETKAEAAGGMMWPVGRGAAQKAIAMALRHPVGVGNARWHLGNYKGFAEAAYLGSFRKQLFDEIGFYDTHCQANQDGELYLRIMKTGGKIFVDSSIKVIYFPRRNLRELAAQYIGYGKGRAYTTWKHRRFSSWRQAGPLVLVVGLPVSVGLALGTGVWWWLGVPLGYVLSLLGISMVSWRKKRDENKLLGRIDLKTRFHVAAAWAVMHVIWGVGFIYNFFRLILRSVNK